MRRLVAVLIAVMASGCAMTMRYPWDRGQTEQRPVDPPKPPEIPEVPEIPEDRLDMISVEAIGAEPTFQLLVAKGVEPEVARKRVNRAIDGIVAKQK